MIILILHIQKRKKMAAAVIIVYKTAILYETNNRVKLLAVVNDAGSIIILQWYGRRCLLFYCK